MLSALRHPHSVRCRSKFLLAPVNFAQRRLVKLQKLSMPLMCTPFPLNRLGRAVLMRGCRSAPTSTSPSQPRHPSETTLVFSAIRPRISRCNMGLFVSGPISVKTWPPRSSSLKTGILGRAWACRRCPLGARPRNSFHRPRPPEAKRPLRRPERAECRFTVLRSSPGKSAVREAVRPAQNACMIHRRRYLLNPFFSFIFPA